VQRRSTCRWCFRQALRFPASTIGRILRAPGVRWSVRCEWVDMIFVPTHHVLGPVLQQLANGCNVMLFRHSPTDTIAGICGPRRSIPPNFQTSRVDSRGQRLLQADVEIKTQQSKALAFTFACLYDVAGPGRKRGDSKHNLKIPFVRTTADAIGTWDIGLVAQSRQGFSQFRSHRFVDVGPLIMICQMDRDSI
jgi:hypothetical protein